MSYALRNTIILLVALILIYGGGFAYFEYIQKPTIAELELTIESDEQEFERKNQIASQLPDLQAQYEESRAFIDSYEKTLFRSSSPDNIFRFLSLLSATSPVDFDYVYQDSSRTDQYGIVRSQINGTGNYRSVLNFITRIENSEPVQKIRNVVITPVTQDNLYNNVNFNFVVESFYDRRGLLDAPETPGISDRINISQHNPFFPLIRSIPANEDNLPNVENSRLAGIGPNKVYLLDQNNRLNTLQVNDEVYLGRLTAINVQSGRAVFRLNKGGIMETVTLEVQR